MKTTKINNQIILPLSYSFNIESDVTKAQKDVFDYFNLTLNQQFEEIPHGHWLGKTCNYIIDNVDFDVAVFFGLDCVPITNKLYEHLLSKVDKNTICGIEQTCEANKSNGHIYAGPACLAIPKTVMQKVLNHMDRLCFIEDEYSDVAQRFTYDCEMSSVNINFLKVTSCNDPKWRIGRTNTFFGVGTTYDNVIYHHFLIGREPWRRSDFIKKCNTITGDS